MRSFPNDVRAVVFLKSSTSNCKPTCAIFFLSCPECCAHKYFYYFYLLVLFCEWSCARWQLLFIYDAYIDMRACVVVLLRKCVWFRGIKLEWQLPLNGVLRNCQTTICSSAVCRGRAKKQCDGLFKLNKLLLSCGNSCRPQPGCSCAVARFLGWVLASYLGIKNSSMAIIIRNRKHL